MTLKDILGSIGVALNLFLQISPLPSMIEGLKKKEIKSMTISYFIVGILQASFWITYGFGISDPVVWSQNVSCYLIFSFYMNILIYIGNNKKLYVYTNCGLLIVLLFSLYLIPASLAVILATIVSICWQSTNFENIKNALAAKDYERINKLVSYVTCAAFGCMWIYSIMIEAYVMFIPFFYGFLLNLINLLIYYWAQGKLSDSNFLIAILKRILRVDANEDFSKYRNIENIKNDKRELYDNLNNSNETK